MQAGDLGSSGQSTRFLSAPHSYHQRVGGIHEGAHRARVSDVVNKKTAKFTCDALVEMLSRVGRPVKLAISRPHI